MPPCALTYWKYALEAAEISLYPGAAGPVRGWWLPMRIWVLVIPGADAAAPPPEPPEPLELLEPQPAATSEAITAAAMTDRRSEEDLIMRSLLPGVRSPAAAGTASRGPRCVHRPAG